MKKVISLYESKALCLIVTKDGEQKQGVIVYPGKTEKDFDKALKEHAKKAGARAMRLTDVENIRTQYRIDYEDVKRYGEQVKRKEDEQETNADTDTEDTDTEDTDTDTEQ